MSLSHSEKVKLINSLSPAHKVELKNALIMGQGGGGLKSILINIKDGLKPIVKAVGLSVLKEVLLPALKSKIMGQGRKKKLAGKGLKLAGKGCCRGKGISIPILY